MPPSLEDWQALLAPEAESLRLAAAAAPTHSPAATARLRRDHPPQLVPIALELAAARAKAISRFGQALAARLVADLQGVEMASSPLAAAHKARRFAQHAGSAQVTDFCCGIGGDAIALSAAGLTVTGVDADPIRAWMCANNANCQTQCVDVLAFEPAAAWFHLDPSRRAADGTRKFRLDDLSPGPSVWQQLIDRAQRAAQLDGHWGAAIELGPGVDAMDVREALAPGTPFELEHISEHARMTQAVVWLGTLAHAEHTATATALRDGAALSLSGAPGASPIGALGERLIDPDPAFERARLLHAACAHANARAFCPGLGILTADQPPRDAAFFPAFHILAHLPWNAKRVAAWLREHEGGIVEVKTRDKAVDPDALQAQLRADGSVIHTLFVQRIGRAVEAFITRREPAS